MSDDSVKTLDFNSSRFGSFTVEVSHLIELPNGVIGFPDEKRFVLMDHKSPFSWLHSVDNPDLAFVIVDGSEFGSNYDFSPPVGDTLIDLKEDDEFAVLVIVTVRSEPGTSTANLKAPIIVNLRNRKGLQIVLDNPEFSARTSLWINSDDSKNDQKSTEPNK